jgi:hypothetical protein
MADWQRKSPERKNSAPIFPAELLLLLMPTSKPGHASHPIFVRPKSLGSLSSRHP